WLLEVTPELYVGTVSARVRDELWAAVTACTHDRFRLAQLSAGATPTGQETPVPPMPQ
ncbi:type I-E CRISPR-associated endoribonuclease Cas2, partial [Streptomyces drozdowiczii]|uniref:type I-E CRISPR-associated endoribonuclease Cas2 n=1 Tax=Streptomyces drozdowiczii TaxID=202862 RepID=UPI00403C8627